TSRERITRPMPPIHEEVYTVLVCDDVEGEDDFAPRFAADARERARAGGARRRLEMDGPVMPDPDDLLGELRHRLQHGSALPSLILLDDGFSSPDGAGVDRDYLAFATLQRLKHVFAG